MKAFDLTDLRAKSAEELHAMVAAERAALYKTRRDFVFRQTNDSAGATTRRRNLARLLTLITEKGGGAPAPAAKPKPAAQAKPAPKVAKAKPAAPKAAKPKSAAPKAATPKPAAPKTAKKEKSDARG